MQPKILLVSGGSGSGKSLLTAYLAETLLPGKCTVLQHDMYYRGISQYPTFDDPEALDNELLATHLTSLKNRQAVDVPVYSFITHERTSETTRTEPREIIIVDGIFPIAVPELRDASDLTLFVHADDDVRIARRILRNEERKARSNIDDLKYYFDFVKPGYTQHIEPVRHLADVTIHNNSTPDVMYRQVQRLLNIAPLV